MILKASSGIDYRMFYDLLNTIGKKRLDMFHKMKREHESDTEKELYRLRIGDPSERPGNRNAALEQFDDVDKLLGNSGLEFDDVNKSKNLGLELTDAVNLESTRVIPVSEQKRICESLKEHMSYDLSDLKETSTQPDATVHGSMHEACVKNNIPCIGRTKEELCKLTSLNSETQKGDETRNRFSDPETTKSKYLSPEMPGDRDHIMFDLYRIKEVLKDIMNDTDFKLLNIEQCSSSLFDLQFEIDKLGEN